MSFPARTPPSIWGTVLQLVNLAEIKTDQARRVLFENVLDLFMSETGRLTDYERTLMSDILCRLVHSVEIEVRKELARFLTDSGADVPDVLGLLANDKIEVARPVLQESRLLRDEQLIEVIRRRTDEHRMAIALRENLSAEVTDALVEYSGPDVIAALVRNGDAALSQHAIAYLVAESRRVDQYQEPLLDRSELPPELAYRMYWWVSAALRRRILSDFEIDAQLVDDGLQVAAAALQNIDDSESALAKAFRLALRLKERKELTTAFLLQTIRQQHVILFTAALAVLSGLDYRTCWRILRDEGGESFAVLARALDFDRSSFVSMALLLDAAWSEGRGVKPASAVKEVSKLFDSIDANHARPVLKYWQRDSAYQAAIDELKHVGRENSRPSS